MRTRLVTLALGDKHRAVFERVRPGWEAYAARHGYELTPLFAPLDESPRAQARSPAWQKLLVLEDQVAKGAERVVWLDCDIAINDEKAPAITAGVPPERIGAVARDASWPPESAALQAAGVPGMAEAIGFRTGQPPPTVADYYAAYGLREAGDFVNTGVLVLSPAHHRGLFQRLYAQAPSHPDPLNQYEQPHLSHAILQEGLLHPLDRRFNRLWFDEMCALYPFLIFQNPEDKGWDSLVHLCVQSAFVNSWFLHFAGAVQFLGYWRADIKAWRDFTRLFGA
jgi:hypothetical protein